MSYISNSKGLAIALFMLVLGAYIGYSMAFFNLQNLTSEIKSLQNKISYLESRVQPQVIVYQNTTSLSDIYELVKNSVVMIKGLTYSTTILGITYYQEVIGSGFIVNLTSQPLIVTNFHVIDKIVNGCIVFSNGEAYPFDVIGTDKYSDLAILKPYAPKEKLIPLNVASSSTLRVGDIVFAIGNPYGFQSTLSSGIVSQLGRAISVETAGGYLLADLIQITVPINPGNSGGPLLDVYGRVVGITTAIIAGSQNVGFAIPSDTLLREIKDLVEKGYYQHPYLGISGIDIDYIIAKSIGINLTYGVLIQSIAKDSPADKAGLRGGSKLTNIAGRQIYVDGDIIIAVNENLVRNMEDLVSYLERNTVPGQRISLTIIRDGEVIRVPIVLGVRP
ncbi:MAG: trypsin-like peptidase domain-containing protein [Candidatus Methanomethyliaceae archaeon]|nr:trypsin-like peptidase domain-containing protein [Candidatus Methanomethyliaceae archaeon]MDW7970320.1 trypsin-like peptidase domain-containing protein [Nitrososphaerota archaeon]